MRGTDLAERSTARETVAFVNGFFELAVPAVRGHGGWAHKLLGDGLLAVFGALEPAEGHADRALAAAEDMLAAVEGHCPIGIGVNSGLVVVGSIGGGGLAEVGVIGDPVNVAARVQDATRELGEPLLVTAATRCVLDDRQPALESRGSLALKGREKPVTLFGRPARRTAGRCSS